MSYTNVSLLVSFFTSPSVELGEKIAMISPLRIFSEDIGTHRRLSVKTSPQFCHVEVKYCTVDQKLSRIISVVDSFKIVQGY